MGLAAITKFLRPSRWGYSPSCISSLLLATESTSQPELCMDQLQFVGPKAGLSLKGQLMQVGLSRGTCGDRKDWIQQGIHFLHQIGLEYLDGHIINEI